MIQCSVCSEPIPVGGRFCPSCGTPPSNLGTLSGPDGAGQPAVSSGRRDDLFVPGAMLAGRYRIVALLGKGGMGEVYRADDTKLGQTVALKFLPDALASNPDRLARLYAEVRIGRQVSHPNVCRVHDVVEADGRHFVSMEYLDGEDLASLLRRIGRLPPAKALEITRQLCAGLAAAHDKSVIHRDLKPANVMIDGRGVARITDFGLATLAADATRLDATAGTPVYMAPEQLSGQGVTIRSDVYALGLVLFEIFTGRRRFEAGSLAELMALHGESRTPRLSSSAHDVDPAVERVILRCLEEDPAARPASVHSVMAALPGGDPLQAALDAGETPSPEMVAAAGSMDALRPIVGWVCLSAMLLGILAVAHLNSRTTLLGLVTIDKPPDVLAERARQVLRVAGYADPPADTAFGFEDGLDYLRYVRDHDTSTARLDHLDPRAIVFWYRQSPQPLVPLQFVSEVRPRDPPPDVTGMALVSLDASGRLLTLEVVPPRVEETQDQALAPSWGPLFAEAGLDLAQWASTEPKWTPASYCDRRAAWTGSRPERPDTPLRIEAASYRGRPVYFELIGRWTDASRIQPSVVASGKLSSIGVAILVGLFMMLVVGGALLAWRNLRLGRGDRQGALRLASVVFALLAMGWLMGEHHVAALSELRLFVQFLCGAAFATALLWTLYIAFEPYVRRRWPRCLVGWSRVLAGRARDPIVGREILFGCVLGMLLSIVTHVSRIFPAWVGRPPGVPPGFYPPTPGLLLGGRFVASTLLSELVVNLFLPLAIALVLTLFRQLLRSEWAALVALVLATAGSSALGREYPLLVFPFAAVIWALLLVALMRFGLLALVATSFTWDLLQALPLTTETSAWYAGIGVAGSVLLLALALYGFYAALAGRPMLGSALEV